MTRDATADQLRREATAARDLLAAIASDDEALSHDMVEGETSLFEAISAALAEMDECDIIAEGIKAKEREFAQRRKRVENRTERLRGLIEAALVFAELPSVKLPTATLTVKRLPPKYLVEDESLIPDEFWKQPDPVLDRKALGEAFRAGDDIPGVGATNGGISLQVRRS